MAEKTKITSFQTGQKKKGSEDNFRNLESCLVLDRSQFGGLYWLLYSRGWRRVILPLKIFFIFLMTRAGKLPELLSMIQERPPFRDICEILRAWHQSVRWLWPTCWFVYQIIVFISSKCPTRRFDRIFQILCWILCRKSKTIVNSSKKYLDL